MEGVLRMDTILGLEERVVATWALWDGQAFFRLARHVLLVYVLHHNDALGLLDFL